MRMVEKIRRALRGDISLGDVVREVLRRQRAAKGLRRQRLEIDRVNGEPARLVAEVRGFGDSQLLRRFQAETRPCFWPSDVRDTTVEVRRTADKIVSGSWGLAGFGELQFTGEDRWRRDPLTGHAWGLGFHADVDLQRHDGVDVRVLWELNRFGQVIPLGLAYAATGDEKYAETFFSHVDEWIEQDPYGRGPNWGSAMEVALRALNVLAAFDLCRTSAALSVERLRGLLKFFDQHGRFIVDNSEFSHIATSNHYLANVVGLFWIGTLIPELENAREWQRFGLSEMLSEMDKQVLPDGADYESSTGYHRFVTEMLVHSFALADRNGVAIPDAYRSKLRQMLEYLADITKPDGTVPLIGDADGSGFIKPITQTDIPSDSVFFPDAGAYIFRHEDLYLHFNTSDCGLKGRGSHGHNDALSIEVFALGRTFIVDPGSYVYNLDRAERHRFRSTGYHSTVMVDGREQNTTDIQRPFILGNEAKPAVISCEMGGEIETVIAQHYGYRRFREPVEHRRTVRFYRARRCLSIRDVLSGSGEHEFAFTFHIAPGVAAEIVDDGTVRLYDDDGRQLIIRQSGFVGRPKLSAAWCSTGYGHKVPSTLLVWEVTAAVPIAVDLLLVPVAMNENLNDRLANALEIAENIDG